MKVLVTGASGFLGSWFLNHFIASDEAHDVWFVDIKPHPKGIPIDQQDMVSWLDGFDEHVDMAFHFAAPVGGRVKIENDPMYNADAFRLDSAFFRWAVTHADLAVYPSSSAIYPISLQTEGQHSELFEGLVHPDHVGWSRPDELYGFSKLAGEMMGWHAALRYGLDVLAIRPFSGYGPGQSTDYPVPAILSRAIAKEDPLTIWGARQTRDFVYVTDIVDATMKRIKAGVSGFEVMNIASGVATSFEQIARNAAGILSYTPEIVRDAGMPQGVEHRRGNPRLMERYHKLEVPLINGLRWTIESLQNPDKGPVIDVDVDIELEEEGKLTADAVISEIKPPAKRRTKTHA